MIRMSNKLGATLTLPLGVSWRQVPFGISVPSVANAQGEGTVIVGRSRLESRQFTLSGSIYYPSKAQIRAKADELLAFLRHPPIEVFPDTTTERRLIAYPLGMPQDWLDAGAELVVSLPMLAPDPYWYGTLVEDTVQGLSSEDTWQVTVDGTAPTLPVVRVTVGTPGQGLSIEHVGTGEMIDLTGDYLAGDVITVDTARYTAILQRGETVAGIVDRLSDGFVSAGFALMPGVNQLEITGAAGTVTLTYRPRWY